MNFSLKTSLQVIVAFAALGTLFYGLKVSYGSEANQSKPVAPLQIQESSTSDSPNSEQGKTPATTEQNVAASNAGIGSKSQTPNEPSKIEKKDSPQSDPFSTSEQPVGSTPAGTAAPGTLQINPPASPAKPLLAAPKTQTDKPAQNSKLPVKGGSSAKPSKTTRKR
jgi:hypothetical protein